MGRAGPYLKVGAKNQPHTLLSASTPVEGMLTLYGHTTLQQPLSTYTAVKPQSNSLPNSTHLALLIWGIILRVVWTASRSGACSLHEGRSGGQAPPRPKALSEDSGPLPGLGGHCNPAALSGVFPQRPVSAGTMPALWALLPAGSGGREGGPHCHTASNSHQTAATTVGFKGYT